MPVSDRYERQYGLVFQDRVEDLRILIKGWSSLTSFTLTNLGLLGAGNVRGGIFLFIEDRIITKNDVQDQFLLDEKDIGDPLQTKIRYRLEKICPRIRCFFVEQEMKNFLGDIALVFDSSCIESKIPTLYGNVGEHSIYIGTKPKQYSENTSNILKCGLSSLCGGLISQEVLRITGCLRSRHILKSWTTLNFIVREPGLGLAIKNSEDRPLPKFCLRLGGEDIPSWITSSDVRNDDEVLVRAKVESSTLQRLLNTGIEIDDPIEAKSPIENFVFSILGLSPEIQDSKIVESKVEIPKNLTNKNIFLAGIGGLGSWLAAIFSASHTQECLLNIFDKDGKIEEHNLNRQILFSSEDIGKPKAYAAEKRIKIINPTIKTNCFFEEILPNVIDAIETEEIYSYEDKMKKILETPAYLEINFSNIKELELKLKKKEEEQEKKQLLKHLEYAKKKRDQAKQLEEKRLVFLQKHKEEISITKRKEIINEYISQRRFAGEVGENISSASVIGYEICKSDIIASCLDNMLTRYVLSVAAHMKKIPLVNAGAQDLVASLDLVTNNTPCLLCNIPVANMIDPAVISCTEEGEVPVMSMVTVISIAASLQTLLLLCELAEITTKVKSFRYLAQKNHLTAMFKFENESHPQHVSPQFFRDQCKMIK